MWVSLFGAALCVAIMFIVSVESSLLLFAVFATCLAYFHYSHPDVNWGDSNQAFLFLSIIINFSSNYFNKNSSQNLKNFKDTFIY
jgi:purine-cytosine permease-like protein